MLAGRWPGLCQEAYGDKPSLTMPLLLQATVWTLRFFTGRSRGSALSESTAGVQVCLVGQTGDAVLHRISAHRDAASECQDLLDICKVGHPSCHTAPGHVAYVYPYEQRQKLCSSSPMMHTAQTALPKGHLLARLMTSRSCPHF